MTQYETGEYLAKNALWHTEDSPWKARQIRDLLADHHITPRTVAEVGCGAGAILTHLAAAFPATRFVGYDVSPQAIALAHPYTTDRIRFVLGEIDTTADVLLCIDVFEHVDDYLGFLRSIKAHGRAVVFHIPLDVTLLSVWRDKMLDARRDVGHLHYFTPLTALATLQYVGYRVLASRFTPGFRDLPGRSWKTRLAQIPRRLLYALSPRLLAKTLGGVSLLVLAE